MPLFATFLASHYSENDQQGTSTFAAIREASSLADAKNQTMNRLAESKPGRQFGQPMAVSMEVPAWQLRQAQEQGKSLFMVGITTSATAPGIGETIDLKARLVVASDRDAAVRQASEEVRRQHPHDRQVDVLTVTTTPDVIAKSLQEWDRQRGNHQEPTQQNAQIARQAIDSKRSNVLPHKEAREAAIHDVTRPWSNYARSVIESAHSNSGSHSAVLYAHASMAAEEGRASFGAAAKIANNTLRQYEGYREKGLDHEQAREQVSREIGERFNERGRDTQSQGRKLSQGQSQSM